MDNFTKANVNLNAILRNLKDLCEMDSESSDIIKSKKVTIQFIVKGGIEGTLFFDNGKVFYEKGKHPSDIILYFFSPEHLNGMFDGTKIDRKSVV